MTSSSFSSDSLARLQRFLRSPLFPIFMIVFVDVLGLGITLPVLPLYAQNLFAASALQISFLSSAYFVAQFLAAPRLGHLSDRIGRRPVLILSQTGTLAAFLISGAAPSLPFLFVARVIDGVTGGNISVAQAYLSDITDAKNRASGLGVVSAAFGTGFIIGPALGALIAAVWGPRAPFFLAAVVSVLTITLSFFLLPESLTPERRQQDAARRAGSAPVSNWALLRQPTLAIIAVIAFGMQFAFFSFQPTYVLWAEQVLFPGRDTQFVQGAVGSILTWVGVFGVMTQFWLVKPLVKRYGEKWLVGAGILVRGVAWISMAVFPLLAVVLVVAPLLSVGGGVALPALMALVTYAAPPDQRGQAIGLIESVQGVGRILGPLVSGQLFEAFGPSTPLMLAAAISLLTVIASLGLRPVKVEHQEGG